MKKSIRNLLFLLITCLLLTGCKAKEEDIEKSKNPEKYITESFQNFYKKEIEIINTNEIDVDGDITKLMEISLKEDDTFVFNACTYWAISSPIPSRYYTSVNNYENKYNTKFLQESLKDTFGTITTESKSIKYNEACSLDKENITLELKDISLIDNLLDKLVEIQEKKEIYAVSLKIVYLDKSASLVINDLTTREDILKELSKLTEENK